jgi:hypothetical protein
MKEQKETEFVDDEVIVCQICGSAPSEWVEFGDEMKDCSKRLHIHKAMHGMIAMTDQDGNFIPNDKMRKALYKTFTYLKFGHLGQSTRIPIPSCVVSKIRKMFPEPDGNYIGFHEE